LINVNTNGEVMIKIVGSFKDRVIDKTREPAILDENGLHKGQVNTLFVEPRKGCFLCGTGNGDTKKLVTIHEIENLRLKLNIDKEFVFMDARPRKRVVPRAKRRGSIRLFRTRIKASSRKQHVVATVRAAAGQRGNTFVYLPRLGKMTAGIYRIAGSKKTPKIRLIYDLSRTSVRIPKTPGLRVSVNRVEKRMPLFYKEAFERRLKKSIKLKGF